MAAYRALGARLCQPVPNGLDPAAHYPTAPVQKFRADLSLLANRLPDREARISEFFLQPARTLAAKRFFLGGAGWEPALLPSCCSAR